MCRRKNKWKWKIKSGWQHKEDDLVEVNKKEYDNGQIIQTVPNRNIFEKIFKWIIYGILFLAIPRYLKSSRAKGKEIVNNAYKKLKSNEFTFIPIGYAMYLFLSFIPISLILVSIITSIRPEYNFIFRHVILGRIIPNIETILPQDISTIWTSVDGAITFTLLIISVIWIASKGYSKFILSIDALYEHKTAFRAWKSMVKGIFVCITLIVILTILLLAFTAFMTLLIEKAGFASMPKNLTDPAEWVSWDKTPKTWFLVIYYFTIILFLPVSTYLGFGVFYLYAPNFKLKFPQIHPGALITSIPTSFFILIFGSITPLIKYNKFGPVAAFMYLILLMTFISYFTYTGIIVNSSFYKTFVNIITIDKGSIFSKKNSSITIEG
ncbi:YhjD/YihY/BrkB family envelope integrity protein [Metamycoplasma hyosynoviae]|uniref:YhjD/YihY/BrkB family envelope integrity protein n=1 Tax=Metamycoplasma hyosynoviae TaxID=29559 RepID=UPI00235E8D0C|nr:YhjD/YihY/BrkB family envelope integrity protein [Metamycoplasma hyosynoviae]MDD1371331.1 YhjD/YihY/BrkB family envelope integrity protein [Metamycoplasma hyosynoviae]